MNLGRGRLEAMLKVLDVEGAVSRDGSRGRCVPDSAWTYDAERYARVTALRRREQEAMAAFGADGRCLMRALQEELDDPDPQTAGAARSAPAPRYDAPLDADAGARGGAASALAPAGARDQEDGARRQTGTMRKLPDDVRAEQGRALARLGDGGWDPVIQRGLRAGRFDDELVDGRRGARARRGSAPVAWVAAVPSRRAAIS